MGQRSVLPELNTRNDGPQSTLTPLLERTDQWRLRYFSYPLTNQIFRDKSNWTYSEFSEMCDELKTILTIYRLTVVGRQANNTHEIIRVNSFVSLLVVIQEKLEDKRFINHWQRRGWPKLEPSKELREKYTWARNR